ncbi:hypothetical protein J3R82DRAFT_10297 [Butyriboletus roseoflavus]|nr:hypothetical protein J3R82DRAFT_10297 [Butyriboletus roseoflavus]
MPVASNDEIELDAPHTRCSCDECIQKVLQILRLGCISLLDCILDILNPSRSDFMVYQKLFLANPFGKLTQILDLIFENDYGRAHLLHWMEPHTIDLLCMKISDEMDDVKRLLGGTLSSITPESLRAWDVNTFIGSVINERAPITDCILQIAVQMNFQFIQVDSSKACNVIITQLVKEHSQLSVYFATPFTLFLWTNGASSQIIEALYKCGLCMSFSSLTKLINNLVTQSLEWASCIAHGPHIMCYDNIKYQHLNLCGTMSLYTCKGTVWNICHSV